VGSNSNSNICWHLPGDFLSQEMRTEMLCRRMFGAPGSWGRPVWWALG